ncbi:hypothetical protein [Actinacidiphila acididurans]|uniref:Thiol:disulfide interchange protein DsbD N-terminal domain-containing protein n=1 Tax=Actinacidiphila acididurans TaxID=2784346 RepID=A0ABS2TWW5_9ACTN|nr:hypothetical protein [Actinacidiphila acididurans]MBM9507838.1 hypothetical protein [Actinacidiphila acididurans]
MGVKGAPRGFGTFSGAGALWLVAQFPAPLGDPGEPGDVTAALPGAGAAEAGSGSSGALPSADASWLVAQFPAPLGDPGEPGDASAALPGAGAAEAGSGSSGALPSADASWLVAQFPAPLGDPGEAGATVVSPRRAGAFRKGLASALGAVTAAVALAGCGGGSSGGVPDTHGSFRAGGVAVSVTLHREAGHGGGGVLVTATLRPEGEGFHVYSLEMPDGGVEALGIPTRLGVGAPLEAAGAVTAGVRPYELSMAGLDVKLPVYPDGPVTLRLPARITGKGARAAEVTFTYGACSATEGCRAPVRGRALTVALPGA